MQDDICIYHTARPAGAAIIPQYCRLARGADDARALALWQRLDRRALLRTSLPPAIIRAIPDPGVSDID